VNLSEIWIKRPVMTIIVMSGILLFGIISYLNLPINNLPATDFPTILVTASMPGASPENMASTVAKPLEKHFSSIAGLTSMSSQSFQGYTQIILQFTLDRNIDNCAQDVSSKINAAQGELPSSENMPTPPTYEKVNPSDQPIMWIALTSDTMPLNKLNDYAENYLAQNFSTVDGVSQVSVYGRKFAVRVQVNPKLLAYRGIGINQIENAIKNQNVNIPGGTLDGSFQSFTIDSNGQMFSAEQYREMIVAYNKDYPVKIKDIGDAIDGVERDKQFAVWYGSKNNIKHAIAMAIKKQPGANAVKVSQGIKEMIPRLKTMTPESISWHLLYDASDYIKESILDVQFTLLLTIFIVLIVIFLFLRSFRSTIIPNIAIPLSIIATFCIMDVLGYSLNNLSLMALVLAVGLVVDDAIVMLENTVRRMEMGEDPMTASLEGSKEIGFTIISMTLSLVVVFIPILFMPGIIGRLFREFAVSIAVAIMLSGFISITLTPMLCSRILKGFHEKKQGRFYEITEHIINLGIKYYGSTLRWVLNHRLMTLCFTALVLIGTALMFMKIPKGFLPGQDQNFFMSYLMASDRTSYEDMVRRTEVINRILQEEEDMRDFVSVASLDTYGKGIVFVNLKKTHERKRTADEIVDEIRPRLNSVPGLIAYPQNPPPIQIGAGTSLAQYQCTLQSSDLDDLYRYAGIFEAKMKAVPWITDVNTDVKLNSPKVYISVDREKASALGLTMAQIQNAFFTSYGSRKVSTIYAPLDEYYVILEVQPEFKKDPNALSYLYVQSKDGRLIPLNTVATLKETTGPISVSHTGQLNSATISFNLKPGYSIGQAVDMAKVIARNINLPQSIVYTFQGSAEEFQKSFRSMGFLLIITIIVLYMILAILYESFIHPITILTALPLAGFGAILTLIIFGKELDMYGMVGIILLIGIVKKNGIMMVDFALEAERTEGLEPMDSIHKACMIRFRPIMMTTMAALFGSMPIALGIGAGGDARQPMGLAVVGGLIFSQLMTLYVTPVFYVYFDEFNKWMGRKKA